MGLRGDEYFVHNLLRNHQADGPGPSLTQEATELDRLIESIQVKNGISDMWLIIRGSSSNTTPTITTTSPTNPSPNNSTCSSRTTNNRTSPQKVTKHGHITISAPPATPYMYPSTVQYQPPHHYEYAVQPATPAYCDPYTQAPYYTASACPQTPPQVDYVVVQDGAARAVRPQISVQTVAGPYAGPYTPVSSNPSSGSNTPQMVHCDPTVPPQVGSRPALFPSRYEYVNGNESMISPITPSTVATAPNLLLAQPRLHYNVHHQHHHHQDTAPHVVDHCPPSPIRPSVE
ncbi:5057_t:CDS:2, partial [Acaulospora colombiana]